MEAPESEPQPEPDTGDESDTGVPVNMTNTKAQIVDAAHAAGLLDESDDGSAWTKAQLLDLWS